MGSVFLVGAGCGAADLITRRGLALLRDCQAVVYDDLIDPELLYEAPDDAERIYVGKRGGRPSARQTDICRLLIDLAQQGKRVVRLKGGDPFVFGRGGEELSALQQAGIPCGTVPGISSAIAVPAAAGIPVTYREVSRAVHIVTAHTSTEEPLPFDRLARLEGTLVFLMGLGQLSAIAKGLIAAGKAPETPAAVCQMDAVGGRCLRGTLSELPELTRAAGVVSPAVIVVGPAAALTLSDNLLRPLEGLRVGLTGTSAFTDKLVDRLRMLGAGVFHAQTARVQPLSCPLPCPSDGNWIVFTSGNGVRCFFQRLTEQKLDIRRFARCHFAVIGGATGEVLGGFGIQPELCPDDRTSAALADALLDAAAPDAPLLLFRSAQATPLLPNRLRQAGRTVRDFRLYDVTEDHAGHRARAAQIRDADCLVFASAGGVRTFVEEFGDPPETAVCVCIGTVTAAALAGCCPHQKILTASKPSATCVLETILQYRSTMEQAMRAE